MYFLYALLAVLAYSVHNAFLSPLYREINDKLAIVFYRGMCISISFSPALLLVPKEDFSSLSDFLPAIILASSLAVVGTWAAIQTVNFMAVGVANTLLNALSSIFILLVSVIFLGEVLSYFQLLLILLILLCVLALGFSPASGRLPVAYNPKKGILFCLTFAVFTGSAYVLLGVASRTSNPILVGYAWESMVGMGGGVLLFIRKLLRSSDAVKAHDQIISVDLLRRIFICSAPAGAGTAFYALSMSQGSIAIASAILNLCMVGTTLLTVTFFGERLSIRQWQLLFFICVFVSALKFVV